MAQLPILSLLSYLIGSIPFAFILVKFFARKDILNEGSGNVGARNAYEITGKKWIGLVVFVLDFSKGIAAVFIGKYFSDNGDIVLALASIFVVLGHNFSIFLGLRGGRGLATSAGVLLLLQPLLLIFWGLVWLISYRLVVKDILFANSISTILSPFAFFFIPEFFSKQFSLFAFDSNTLLFVTLGILSLIIISKHIQPLREKFLSK